MPSFRTEIKLEQSSHRLTLRDTILTTGSCFSDAIGTKLSQNKFSTSVNPFGIIYNPCSIHKALTNALLNEPPSGSSYVQNGELFLNYDYHSEFSALSKNDLETRINDTLHTSQTFLKEASWIFITYGTAWVYERIDTHEVVANCHKIPANNFIKRMLSPQEVETSFRDFYTELKAFNPACKIILTISPVRHVKDTLPLNSVSKAALRLACQNITESFSDVFYFPAYEIMLDDLRDYRFYKSDMLHPSEEAENYIWNKFAAVFFDAATLEFLKKWQAIYTALQHKPFHTQATSHQQFLKKLALQLEELKETIDVKQEIVSVNAQLIHGA